MGVFISVTLIWDKGSSCLIPTVNMVAKLVGYLNNRVHLITL